MPSYVDILAFDNGGSNPADWTGMSEQAELLSPTGEFGAFVQFVYTPPEAGAVLHGIRASYNFEADGDHRATTEAIAVVLPDEGIIYSVAHPAASFPGPYMTISETNRTVAVDPPVPIGATLRVHVGLYDTADITFPLYEVPAAFTVTAMEALIETSEGVFWTAYERTIEQPDLVKLPERTVVPAVPAVVGRVESLTCPTPPPDQPPGGGTGGGGSGVAPPEGCVVLDIPSPGGAITVIICP